MKRRTALIGLGGVFAGLGGLLGTSAFSSVEASRTATVETAGDASALLGIEPANSEYVDITGGTVAIDIDNVNRNAVTVINPILEVTNNGSNPVETGFNDELVENREEFETTTNFGLEPAAFAGDEKAFLILWGPYNTTIDPITKQQLTVTGFNGSSGLIKNNFDYDFAQDREKRVVSPGGEVFIGATVDTRERTLANGIPPELDDTFTLVGQDDTS